MVTHNRVSADPTLGSMAAGSGPRPGMGRWPMTRAKVDAAAYRLMVCMRLVDSVIARAWPAGSTTAG